VQLRALMSSNKAPARKRLEALLEASGTRGGLGLAWQRPCLPLKN